MIIALFFAAGGTIGMEKNSEGKLEATRGYLEWYMEQIPFLNSNAVSSSATSIIKVKVVKSWMDT